MFEDKFFSSHEIRDGSPLCRLKVLFERSPKYKGWYAWRIETTVEKLLKTLKINKGTFLDLGCGSGWLSVGIDKKTNCKCVGIDVEEDLIAFSKERAKYEGAMTEFLLADGMNLPFKNESFDFIAAIDVLEHVKDYKRCLREIVRVLNNKGRAILIVPNRFAIYAPGHTNLKTQLKKFVLRLKGENLDFWKNGISHYETHIPHMLIRLSRNLNL